MEIVIRATVTDVESFRRYREQEEMSLQELMKRLRREEGPSDTMRAGSALHSILEAPDFDEATVAEKDGHRFHFTGDLELALMPFREISAKREYVTEGGRVELRGRTDALDALTLADHKFTTNNFDAERYADAYQWRLYLSMFGARKFIYNVFESAFIGTVCPSDSDGHEHDAGCAPVMEWEVKALHELPLYRYPELDADVERELGLYATFAKSHLLGIAA